MDLNLFENKKREDHYTNDFIEELRNALNNKIDELKEKNEDKILMDEYNLYEKRKVFLDNKSRKGNDLLLIMDENSVCLSQNGDGGPISIKELETEQKLKLPKNRKIGEVYEKIRNNYVYNHDITMEMNQNTR